MDSEKVKSFLEQLGITSNGSIVDNSYVVDLENSNAYSRVYTILDKSELTDLDIDNVHMDAEGSIMTYLSDDYDIILKSNFDDDLYTLTIEEASD